jgi:hypothetical protein
MSSPHLASPTEVAEFLNIAPSTLRDWRTQGIGPKYYRISYRDVRYDLEDVRSWLQKKAVLPGDAGSEEVSTGGPAH